MSAVVASGITKSYGPRRVLDAVDLRAEPGHITAIFGPSGSGKTTLLRIINGLEKPDAGQVTVMGSRLVQGNGGLGLRRQICLVSQRPVVLRGSVRDNVAYPLRVRGMEDAGRVSAALESVGLSGLEDARASTLSGGELQRMCFARATVHRPAVLLLDEFTSHLDPANIRLLESALRGYVEAGGTAVVVTHNLFQARRLSHMAGFLLEGQMVEFGPTQDMFERPGDRRTEAFIRGDMVF